MADNDNDSLAEEIRDTKRRFAATDPLPTSRPRSSKLRRVGDTTSSPSSSSSSSVFSAGVERATGLMSSDCWICGSEYGVDLKDLRDRQILPSTFNIGGIENAISLCKRCHHALNTPIPMLILVPLNLQTFRDFEKNDFQQRL
ncbi:hypothetical protein TWF506_004379 [Arthrobotrys conoides]|uniref:Uncharacterized protein n=1 Tax=Arthrobotrys conoides TaxID=74498 RepID=A0AAN8P409_9PEZI